MAEPTDKQKSAWRALFRVQSKARAHAEADLKRANLPSMDVYDALLELDRDDAAEGLTAKQLEPRLLLPQYGVSRLLDRLAKQRLIERRPNPEDQRSSLITITPQGRDMRAAIWAVYGKAIGTFFEQRIKPGQLDRLNMLLDRLDNPKLG